MNDNIEFTDNELGEKFTILYDEHANIETSRHGNFDAKIDGADHAAFHCEKCKREARVVKLAWYKETKEKYKNEIIYTLWFDLYCEMCGAHNHKKLYPNLSLGVFHGHNWCIIFKK